MSRLDNAFEKWWSERTTGFFQAPIYHIAKRAFQHGAEIHKKIPLRKKKQK